MTKEKNEIEKKIEAAITGGGNKGQKKIEKNPLNRPKKKKKLSSVTKRICKVGEFEIRISEAKVDIETTAKTWNIRYAYGTTPYYVISSLVLQERIESLRTLILALYSTSIFFVDADTVVDFIKIVHDFQGDGKKQLTEEEDQAILEEERLAATGKDSLDNDDDDDNVVGMKKALAESAKDVEKIQNEVMENTFKKIDNEIKKEDKEDETLS